MFPGVNPGLDSQAPSGRKTIPKLATAATKWEENNMNYRSLGRSGLKVSPLCLGTMMFGGQTDEPTSGRIIAHAREAGINFIDSADVYNDGRSEEIVGRAVA